MSSVTDGSLENFSTLFTISHRMMEIIYLVYIIGSHIVVIINKPEFLLHFLEAIASLVVTFSLTHSLSQSVSQSGFFKT